MVILFDTLFLLLFIDINMSASQPSSCPSHSVNTSFKLTIDYDRGEADAAAVDVPDLWSDPKDPFPIIIPDVIDTIDDIRIHEIIDALGWGVVESVDIQPSSEHNRKNVFVQFTSWKEGTDEVRHILDNETHIKVVYNDLRTCENPCDTLWRVSNQNAWNHAEWLKIEESYTGIDERPVWSG